jgi:hypothetical protein
MMLSPEDSRCLAPAKPVSTRMIRDRAIKEDS